MSILLSCQPPPPVGWVTVGERDCQFVSRQAAEASTGAQIPDLHVQPDAVHVTDESPSHLPSPFLPVDENRLKKLIHTWRDHGLVQALEELSTPEKDSEATVAVKITSFVLGVVRQLRALHSYFSPHSQMNVPSQKHSPLSDWETSICAIALHPRLPYVAVGRQDDAIEIRHHSQPDYKVVLRDKKQVAVVCIQWAPHCNTLFAAGTATGVLLWNVDPTAHTTRFLTSWVRVETSPGHAPISTLSWSPHGNFLVSASPADCNLIIWDIPMGVSTAVKRVKGGGLTQVSWSPDGQRVVAATVSAVFRVWETQSWTCETWTHASGRCKVCCWSPRGDLLVFALEGDPSLYYLSFLGQELAAGSSSAVKCADLTPCIMLMAGGEEVEVGGIIRTMAWDPSGERLAIVFTPDSPSAHMVLVLRTRTSHMLEILPGGFLRGQDEELPEIVAFQENYREGALLAVAWSSGRTSFYPLHFHPSHPSHPEQLASLSQLHKAPSPTATFPLYHT